jgi:hydroxyethylthiazole kinase-like uncharacterized protein yjeF
MKRASLNFWTGVSGVRQASEKQAVSVSQMRRFDQHAIRHLGMPSMLLMEHAGKGVANVVQALIKGSRGWILVLCGKGNNGGDGLVAARHLWNQGIRVTIGYTHSERKMSEDTRLHFQIARKLKIPRVYLGNRSAQTRFFSQAKKCRMVIDALLGTGLKSAPKSPYDTLISWVNHQKALVLSVDIPSGLNGDRGTLLGEAIQADMTVTCGLPKLGFYRAMGPRYTGRLFVVDIGHPRR